MSDTTVDQRWRVLFTPRWLSWHLFAVAAFTGMLWLGDWQFRRAMAGNGLSWAYTFEWPVFAIFGAVFWVKTVRDELRPAKPAERAKVVLPAGAAGDGAAAAGGAPQPGQGEDADGGENDVEFAEYNAYLAMLSRKPKSHSTWHGLR